MFFFWYTKDRKLYSNCNQPSNILIQLRDYDNYRLQHTWPLGSEKHIHMTVLQFFFQPFIISTVKSLIYYMYHLYVKWSYSVGYYRDLNNNDHKAIICDMVCQLSSLLSMVSQMVQQHHYTQKYTVLSLIEPQNLRANKCLPHRNVIFCISLNFPNYKSSNYYIEKFLLGKIIILEQFENSEQIKTVTPRASIR